jgi:signal transduction histidine kinase
LSFADESCALRCERAALGLGLYIARQIVEAHRGRLEVVSEVGKGSEFNLYLPLPGAAAA